MSKANLFDKVRRDKFVRVYKLNGEIKAWIYADMVVLPHCSEPYFQQMYYGSSLKGSRAFKAVVELHEEMYNYAAANTNAVWCTSSGSIYDEQNTFARILERSGWERRGYLAARRVAGSGRVGPERPPGAALAGG